MIVIAIIGVLAAALFPSYSGYLQRSRDTHRITSLSTLTRALQLHFNDKESYPTSTAGGCIDDLQVAKYNDGTMPKDIIPTYDNGCVQMEDSDMEEVQESSSYLMPIFLLRRWRIM